MHIIHISAYSAYVHKCFLQCVAVCCSVFFAHVRIVTRCTCICPCNAAQFTETNVIYGFQMSYFV